MKLSNFAKMMPLVERCWICSSVRWNSSMFGSNFKDTNSRVDGKSKKQSILHLNAAHGHNSLVAVGARELLANLSFAHSATELNLWNDGSLFPYSVSHAVAKLNILAGKGSREDEELFAPVLDAARLLNAMDMVIVSTPMWNYTVPYVLKQYIDIVVQPGINFQDQDQSPCPELAGRRLVVFSSAGATYDASSRCVDYLNSYLGQVFGLMGFDKQNFVFIQGSKGLSTHRDLEEWTLEEARKVASEINKDCL